MTLEQISNKLFLGELDWDEEVKLLTNLTLLCLQTDDEGIQEILINYQVNNHYIV